MSENQHIEYKESWRDENLKTVCAFANIHGGSLFIGIRDDGSVVGMKNLNKLLEDIPNKVIGYLGIIVDVHTHKKSGLEYIEVNVPQSSVPIAYRGTYYVKSGSTKQELKGVALNQFLLKRAGRTWDDLPCESATLQDIDPDVVKYFFKKAFVSKRIADNTGDDDLKTTLENLNLLTDSGHLKNAALLLFGKRPSRFFPSVSFKTGRFIDGDDDLRFQDVVEGNILQMADKVMDILKSKYLISPIHYEGLQRIEKLEVPEDSLREAIFNSIIHKDYTGAPIQLSVYNDKIILWNEGRLPEGFTIETLLEKHPSRPGNKNIADIFFKAGFIEAWGRGIAKIINGFVLAGLPAPVFMSAMGGIMVTIMRGISDQSETNGQKGITGNVTDHVTENVTENRKESLLGLIKRNNRITTHEMAEILSVTRMTIARDIESLKQKGKLRRIGPSKGGHWQINEK